MENKSTRCNDVLSQSFTQINQKCSKENADLLTNVAAAVASVDTELEEQATYSQVSQQTETTTHSHHDYSYFMPDLCTLGDTLICAKQLQDGQVPEALQHFDAAKVDDSDLDGDLEKDVDSVTRQGKRANTENKQSNQAEQCASMSTQTTDALQHQQLHNTTTSNLTVLSRPPRPLVLPTSAEDSVRRHYVSPKLQATGSRLIANSAVNSLSLQSNNVNNASPAQPEDLLVAVPVEEDEVHGYAVKHDVSQHKLYKQLQTIRARRISYRLYFSVFLLVAAAVMITSLVVIKKNKNDSQQQETETEMTWLQNMTQYNPQGQLIVSIMGADAVLLNDASSPYAKALTWLLQSNDIQNKSYEMTSTLAQRFYAACFYYDTTTDDYKWYDCNPPNSSSELDQTCTDPFHGTEVQAWLSDSHECEWFGVGCDHHQQIISLELWNMDLVGTIPSCTAKFPFLQKLWLRRSQLEGNVSLLSDCHHVTSINFFHNLLSEDLSSVWQHRKLMYFNVGNNYLTGSLSSQIGNLVDLVWLSLQVNNLTGTVPSEIGWLNSILIFDISINFLGGKLPQSIQSWDMIELFDVGENQFSGLVSTFLGQFNTTTLQILDLRDNSFTGTLPDELFHLSELHRLEVSNNELSGTLDARIAQLKRLQWTGTSTYLGLSGNHFTGTIPTELSLLPDIVEIYLQGNDFTGSVPASLCQNREIHLGFIFIADCTKDDNGQAELQCDCCTSCCQADGTQCERT